MFNLKNTFLLPLFLCLVLLTKNTYAGRSKNKFYFEPFFKVDYQIWQNDQQEEDNGTYIYKFRGLYYGPRIGAKFLGIYRSWLVYGIEGSYSYYFNTYSPDPDETKDDSFKTDSNSTQTQFGVFTGFQYKRYGLKLQYIPLTTIENNDKYTTFKDGENIDPKNSYSGTGFGVGISYVYRPKVNFYFEYQAFSLNKFTIDGQDYNLPTSAATMTFKELTTTKYSFGISMIF